MSKLHTLVALLTLPLTLSACTTYVPDTLPAAPSDYYGGATSYTTGYGTDYGQADAAPSAAPQNAPVILALDAVPGNSVAPGATVVLHAEALAPQGGLLDYHWASTDGLLSADAGRNVSWTAPEQPGNYGVTLLVANAQGDSTTGTIALHVRAANEAPSPLPVWAPTPNDAIAPTSDETPSPDWSVLPTPTPMPEWSTTPAPTPMPEWSATPAPTPTPFPTPTPEASATPSPTPTGTEEHHRG